LIDRTAGTNQVIYANPPTALDTALLDLAVDREQEERKTEY
jgi:hypothetical protein